MKTLKIITLMSVLSVGAILRSAANTDIIFPSSPAPLPDLTGSYMDSGYDAGSGAFLVTGWTTDYNISDGHGGATDVGVSVLDAYTLSATINNSGVLTGGTITIDGAVGNGNTSVTLLTANLVTGAAGTAFGYGDGGNNLFQFRFNVTGGTLASAFGGTGAAGGVILDAWFDPTGDNPFTGSWAGSFDSHGSQVGAIDCFAVPEPSSGLLLSVGGALLMGAYRCRRNTLSV